ncbi:E3 ubiquitin--protein ligase, partial [Salmonella enterica subsp. salamae]|nr:E3 ubiquitin--protein ligase [Salmonella enterica subsp. salamae]
ISHLHFDECRFTHSTLHCATCANTKFSHSDMNEVFLQYLFFFAREQPSFINTTLKNTIMYRNPNLSGVILNEPDNSPPPPESVYRNAIRLGDIWLPMPL